MPKSSAAVRERGTADTQTTLTYIYIRKEGFPFWHIIINYGVSQRKRMAKLKGGCA